MALTKYTEAQPTRGTFRPSSLQHIGFRSPSLSRSELLIQFSETSLTTFLLILTHISWRNPYLDTGDYRVCVHLLLCHLPTLSELISRSSMSYHRQPGCGSNTAAPESVCPPGHASVHTLCFPPKKRDFSVIPWMGFRIPWWKNLQSCKGIWLGKSPWATKVSYTHSFFFSFFGPWNSIETAQVQNNLNLMRTKTSQSLSNNVI